MGRDINHIGAVERRLVALYRSGAPKAAMSGLRAYARETEKGIKDAIPGQYRDARKTTGRKVRKNGDEVVAKVGLGVGKQSASKKPRKRSGGVGLSKNNIHWAVFGVSDRRTKSGKYRGRHDGFLAGVVKTGASNAELRAALAAREAVKKELEKALK